jgi:hypothetical protein
MTQRLAGWWIADQRYYRMSIVAREHAAPEYRIAEDVRLSIDPLTDFVIGIAMAVGTGLTFVTVLWTQGGSYTLTAFGATITIPAYMAIAAMLYGATTATAAYLTGRPLVGHVSHKNQMEAEFRAEMTRLRENGESIALIRGDEGELRSTLENYSRIVGAWMKVIRQQGVISSVYNLNVAFYPVAPLLLAAPKYLAGEMTLGSVMQTAAAFSAVLSALNWFADNFVRLAEWFAGGGRRRRRHRSRRADRPWRQQGRIDPYPRFAGGASRRPRGCRQRFDDHSSRRQGLDRGRERNRQKHADPRARGPMAMGRGRDRNAGDGGSDLRSAEALYPARQSARRDELPEGGRRLFRRGDHRRVEALRRRLPRQAFD